MPSTLEREMQSDATAERESALREYLQILSRAREPQPDDSRRVRSLAAMLAIDESMIPAHVAAVVEMKELRGKSLAPSVRQTMERHLNEAGNAHTEPLRELLMELVSKLDSRAVAGAIDYVRTAFPESEMVNIHERISSIMGGANVAVGSLQSQLIQDDQAKQQIAALQIRYRILFQTEHD